MDLRIFTEPQQGATYDDLLAVAQRTQEDGFDAFFRSDHYLAMGTDGLPGSDRRLADARRTRAGDLGHPAGHADDLGDFRLPGPFAISVAQVDQMSGGRVEVGIGAGWYEDEHTAYGIPFPSTGERFDRLEEALAVITGLVGDPGGGEVRLRRRALPAARLPRPARHPCSRQVRR